MSIHRQIRELRRNKRKLLSVIAILLAVTAVIVAALLLINYWENQQGELPLPSVGEDTVTYNGQEYTKKQGIDTLLVMGLDKYDGDISSDSYNNDRQSDFLMLFVIDNLNSQVTAVHINRDTMAQVNVLGLAGEKVGTVTTQLALSHTYGSGGKVSCRNTVDAVSGVLMDIDIDNYISVTMDSVPAVNDLVGGVEVTVLEDFTGIDDTLKKGEIVTLLGEHALTYVRTRYGLEDSTNSTRMERQQQYLNALVEKAGECVENDEEFVISAVETISEYMVSNCSVTALESLLEKLSTYEFTEIRSFDGETLMGDSHIEFYPDEASVEEIVMDVLYSPVQ